MKLPACIIAKPIRVRSLAKLVVVCTVLCSAAAAQRLAVISPVNSGPGNEYAEALGSSLARTTSVADQSMSEAAFRAVAPKTPFNMNVPESKIVGQAIGCDVFVLVRSETLRRSSFERAEYYESFAAIYAVSGRSGRMLYWTLRTFDAPSPEASKKSLMNSADSTSVDLSARLKLAAAKESNDDRPTAIEELPPENTPESRNFRAPIPFRRIKPEYTSIAFLYSIEATVEIEADIDQAGKILRTSIVRWAGFGLDESVEKAVRAMNWRPAERNGKPLPMRVLLRYNFKKLDK